MKQQSATIIIATVLSFFNATAAPEDPVKNNTVKVSVTESFNRIVVRDNVDVVLVEMSSPEVSIQGKARQCDDVKLEVKEGVLTISSRRPAVMKQAVVYVPVQQIESITVKGYSDVKSAGTLRSAKLHIRIEGECHVNVVNSGPVTVSNGPDHGYDYELQQKIDL
jgi:Putative auto-transporter adhesin, head GIN domain